MKDPNGTYANEAERQAMMERANQMYLDSKAEREGDYGVQRAKQIEGMKAEVDKLENGTVRSAKEAVTNMAKATKIRAEIERLLTEPYDTLAAQDHNSRVMQGKQAAFSAMQDSLLSAEDDGTAALDAAWGKVVFNPVLGVKRSTLDRQLVKLINGEGEYDRAGNRYVTFSEGSSAAYRAVVTPSGDYGFILASRGADFRNNGLGDLASED